jgi:hypothetical protein
MQRMARGVLTLSPLASPPLTRVDWFALSRKYVVDDNFAEGL